MKLLLHLRGTSFEVYLREDEVLAKEPLRFDSHGVALRWLRLMAQEPWNRPTLRQVLAGLSPGRSISLLEDSDVLEQLARRLASGWVRVVEGERIHLVGHGDEAAEAQRTGFEGVEKYKEKTWITIQLVGEDDKPIPGEKYRITLPDGAVREGRLDAEGLARFTDIDPGTCDVTFPELDEEAWVPIGTSGVP